MVTQSPSRPLHVFEAAGLGKAPFEYAGESHGRTHCDYCRTPIVNQFHVASSDGRRFVVGCECIKKTDDSALTKPMARAMRELARLRQADSARSPDAILRRQCESIINRYAPQLAAIPFSSIPSAGPPNMLTWSRLMLRAGVPADLLRRLKSSLGLSEIY